MIGPVAASSVAMLLARRCTSFTALYMRSRIVFSRLNDLTMRTPKTVSCITRMMADTETSSFSMILRVRFSSLLTENIAIGPSMNATSDSTGCWIAMTSTSPISDNRSRTNDVTSVSTTPARSLGALRHAHDEVGRRIGVVEFDAVFQHAVVDLALPVGDDGISGAAQEKSLNEGGQALDDEDRRDRAGDQIDPVEVLLAGKFVGDVSHHPGARRRSSPRRRSSRGSLFRRSVHACGMILATGARQGAGSRRIGRT